MQNYQLHVLFILKLQERLGFLLMPALFAYATCVLLQLLSI